MAETHLCLHKGAAEVAREQLAAIEAPPPQGRWFPLKHSKVLDTVCDTHEVEERDGGAWVELTKRIAPAGTAA